MSRQRHGVIIERREESGHCEAVTLEDSNEFSLEAAKEIGITHSVDKVDAVIEKLAGVSLPVSCSVVMRQPKLTWRGALEPA